MIDISNHHDIEYVQTTHPLLTFTQQTEFMLVRKHACAPHPPRFKGLGPFSQLPRKWGPGMRAHETISFNSYPSILQQICRLSLWKMLFYLDHYLKLTAGSPEQVITHIHWHKHFCSHKCVKRAPCHHVLHPHKVLGPDGPLEITLSKLFTQRITGF